MATYIVLDAAEHAIKNHKDDVAAAETITELASNPKQGKAGVSEVWNAVDDSGQFGDVLAFGFPDSAPKPGEFLKRKQQLSVATKAQTYRDVRVNCYDFDWDDVTVTEVTLLAAPSAPGNLSAAASASSNGQLKVDLTWAPSTGGSPCLVYYVYRSTTRTSRLRRKTGSTTRASLTA